MWNKESRLLLSSGFGENFQGIVRERLALFDATRCCRIANKEPSH